MAARIVADDAETLFQRVHLIIPHMQIGAERIGHQHGGRAVGAFDYDVELPCTDLHPRHWPCPYSVVASKIASVIGCYAGIASLIAGRNY
ncbi:MAG TPA: hypothetical protein VGU72_18140 [Beijerinckiaceae bacterium]|nr:hypothetical protein [Beijerinckiaceae bacterium]